MNTFNALDPRGVGARMVALLALAAAGLSGAMAAPPAGHCGFDAETLQFNGDAQTQARCLLRKVAKWGKVDAAPATLPASLAALPGQSTGDLGARLGTYLAGTGLDAATLGGPLSKGLSHANGGTTSAPAARYFVIHDTSSPWLGEKPFPADDAPKLNQLSDYDGPESAAHVFVNRLGKTLTGHDFSVPWRATKLENKIVGIPTKGLFLHIELLQPRRRDPAGGPKNDALAPQPGFTQAQYDKLALLYAMASARGGVWLIPAFHAALDEGLADAHDDPQNFELERFAQALEALRGKLAVAP